MEDKFSKFLRLFGTIFFTLVGFILVFVLLMLLLRLIVGSLDYIPWFTYVYMSFFILIPSSLFLSVYFIFFKRTFKYKSKPIRFISGFLFSIGMLSWITVLTIDCIEFLKNGYSEIARYYSYNLLFLFINIGMIFFIGVMQALGAEKEKDWMEKHIG